MRAIRMYIFAFITPLSSIRFSATPVTLHAHLSSVMVLEMPISTNDGIHWERFVSQRGRTSNVAMSSRIQLAKTRIRRVRAEDDGHFAAPFPPPRKECA
ncbi:hypothetical protein DL96DRAFT_499111 [Flagelloscypha sp. PMI_526]|nr:hypothetical protein DL96DRAFT_499111 [Flagelloscypha sp. PMI_526]